MSDQLPDIWQGPAEAIGELLLDKKLETAAPALGQIPLLSIAIAAYKSKGAISDYLLAKKVQQFYTAWERLGERERHKIYQKFQKKPKAFTEKLLVLLAQQEDLEKCRLLGVLTTSYLQGDIKRADYLDMIETVAHLSLRDLIALDRLAGHGNGGLITPEHHIGKRYVAVFTARGLLELAPKMPPEQREDEELYYIFTWLGKSLAHDIRACNIKEAV